jgi:hypothetical protein
VLARLVDGEPGQRKRGIGERADRDGNLLRLGGDHVEHGRTAIGAEVKRPQLPVVVGVAQELARSASNLDVVSRKPGLEAERASCPALARETVADRNAHRLAVDGYLQLPAATGGFALDHDRKGSAECVQAGWGDKFPR